MSLSPSFFLTENDYSWKKALLWGNSIGHFKQCRSGNLWQRPVHLIIALTEALPIVGQVVALFETSIYKISSHRSRINRPIEATHDNQSSILKKAGLRVPLEVFIQEIEIHQNSLSKNKLAELKERLMYLGLALLRGRELEKAIDLLDRALKINENKYEGMTRKWLDFFLYTLRDLGNSYQQEQNFEQAINAFTRSVEICKRIASDVTSNSSDRLTLSSHLIQLAKAYEAQGDLEKATEIFSENLEVMESIIRTPSLFPTLIPSLNYLGNVYSSQGNYERSLYFFNRVAVIMQNSGEKP